MITPLIKRGWGLVAVLLMVNGCASRNEATPPVTAIAPAATDVPRATAAPLNDRDWQVLFRREGTTGSSAIDLRAVGDVMLGRGVADVTAKRGPDYPFAAAGGLLHGELLLGNLESPLTDRRAPLRPGPYRLPAPTASAAALQHAGFAALSLANNHALDVGPDGLRDADTALHNANIVALGAGPDAAAARAPRMLQAGGKHIAVLAFNAVPDPEDAPDEAQHWGRAWLDDAALGAVRAARTEANAVVVLVHWGVEYTAQPTAAQQEWARKLVAAGADLIIGAHPHVLQPTTMVTSGGRSGLVAYSLGNFVFDQPFSQATSTGAVLRVLLDDHGVALAAAAPVQIVAGQPRPAALNSDTGRAALRALGALGSTLDAWRWNGQAAEPFALPSGFTLPTRPTAFSVDLRGDGKPLQATLDANGLATVRDSSAPNNPIVWQNEEANWHVTRMDAGDPNNDGRIELLLLLWKPEANGVLRSHPFILGWRGDHYRIIWGGSATATPIQDLALADLDGDGTAELVVLDGGNKPGDVATHLSVWHWHGWGFQRDWQSPAGQWRALALTTLAGSDQQVIVAQR